MTTARKHSRDLPPRSARQTALHCHWAWAGDPANRQIVCVRCGRRHTMRLVASPAEVFAWCDAPDLGPWWQRVPRAWRSRLWRATLRPRLFFRATGKFLWYMLTHGGRGFLVGAKYAERVAICRGCEHRQDNQCQVCGCKLEGVAVAKLRWATESCPLEAPKWGPLT